ncbi:hypothetical protein GWI33_004834 [Rhynchophorus ferrugineus]|uniref:Uncharacterized protein n=1 Tax=Rhynchophorus ferrugineus TaxID=354439 RepID=A0A834MEB2_RHYFE|nr:hypothetical protein GWI33_004834 [Rhynchophorus ferrugineus]
MRPRTYPVGILLKYELESVDGDEKHTHSERKSRTSLCLPRAMVTSCEIFAVRAAFIFISIAKDPSRWPALGGAETISGRTTAPSPSPDPPTSVVLSDFSTLFSKDETPNGTRFGSINLDRDEAAVNDQGARASDVTVWYKCR